jgi:hypothetical protein
MKEAECNQVRQVDADLGGQFVLSESLAASRRGDVNVITVGQLNSGVGARFTLESSPPASERVDLSLILLRMGPAMLGMLGRLGMLPGMFGIGGSPGMLDMLGRPGGRPGPPPDDGGSWPPAGDLTAETRADMETGDTWETLPKLDGGWLIKAEERFSFGILDAL